MQQKPYDLIVVGGGIAGLAIVEIFARSGFRVALIEKNSKICMETSGVHHEWFHFGSLYSIFPTNQFLRTMVGGIDDLLLYYRDFDGMNLRVNGEGKLVTIEKENKWIRQENLEYIVNTRNDPDFALLKAVGVKDFLTRLLFKWVWDKNIKQFVARHNRFYKYDWRRGCASHYIPKAGWLDYSKEMIERFDNADIRLDENTHFKIRSYDSPMNAYTIISDLTKSFLSYGGEIMTDASFEGYVADGKGVRVYLNPNRNIELATTYLVLALGKDLEKHVKGKISVKTVASPLLVAFPNVCDINFARLTPFMDKTINHLTHEIDGKKYSLIGGGYFANIDDKAQIESVKETLIKRAKEVFPKMENASVCEVYFGHKTEVSASYSKRNYLYHIEKNDEGVFVVVPGKFSLAFSLAVNTFHRLMGHYPNTHVVYKRDLDVAQYIGLMKHKSIITNLVQANQVEP